jgi:hypothetical protein
MRSALHQSLLAYAVFPMFFNNLEEVKYSVFSECAAFFGFAFGECGIMGKIVSTHCIFSRMQCEQTPVINWFGIDSELDRIFDRLQPRFPIPSP